MPEGENKRIRRTPQQIAEAIDVQIEELKGSIPKYEEKKKAAIAEYDKKIGSIHNKIKALEEKKKTVLMPKSERKPRQTKKRKIENLLKQAQKAGMKPEDIAARLGLNVEE